MILKTASPPAEDSLVPPSQHTILRHLFGFFVFLSTIFTINSCAVFTSTPISSNLTTVLSSSSTTIAMYLKAAVLFSLLASSFALPTASGDRKVKRGILSVQDYSDFQVSDGVAGNALAEVKAKFPVCIRLRRCQSAITHTS